MYVAWLLRCLQDDDGHEDECRWCGQGGDVLCCETCDKVFCCPCIKRNFGDEVFDQIADSEDWKCFFCNKQPLHDLRLQYQAVKDALKAQQMQPDTEDDFGDYRITSNKKRSVPFGTYASWTQCVSFRLIASDKKKLDDYICTLSYLLDLWVDGIIGILQTELRHECLIPF